MAGSCSFVTFHLLSPYVYTCLLEGWSLKHEFCLIKGKILHLIIKEQASLRRVFHFLVLYEWVVFKLLLNITQVNRKESQRSRRLPTSKFRNLRSNLPIVKINWALCWTQLSRLGPERNPSWRDSQGLRRASCVFSRVLLWL